MEKQELDRLMKQVGKLCSAERKALAEHITAIDAAAGAADVVAAAPKPACPACASANVGKWGGNPGRPRFRCRDCGRTFGALAGTPFHRMKRMELWTSFAQGMVEGETLMAARDRLGISLKTAHAWRHRFAAALAAGELPKCAGIAEEDETFFAKSEKGAFGWRPLRQIPSLPQPKRPARERGGIRGKRGLGPDQVAAAVVRERGTRLVRTKLVDGIKAVDLAGAIGGAVERDCLLVTDGSKAAAAAARALGLSHAGVPKGRKGADPAHHVQTVNAYHAELKLWIRRFRGVATKCLPAYLAWHAALFMAGPGITGTDLLRMALS